jgi:hypothetical protein
VAQPQPGHAADHDARQLQRAVGGDQADEGLAVARPERQPGDRAEQQAVVGEREDGAHAEQQPADERHERHLDVVDQDLGGEHAALAGAEVAALGRRVGGAGEVRRDEADRGAGIDKPPDGAGRGGDQQERPGERDHARPLGEPAPVPAREERPQAAAPAGAAVDGGASAQHERLQPANHRVAGKAPPRVGEIGRRAAVERRQLEHAAGAEPALSAAPGTAAQERIEPDPVRTALRLETL